MNYLRKLVVFALGLAVTLASAISVYAMSFNAEDAYNSIFVIKSGNSLGSGFSFGENCIITNAHVIAYTSSVFITTYSGETDKAFVVAIDADLDIAVLGVSGITFTPLIPSDYMKMSIGDDVYAVGAPNSMAYTLTKGCISAKERQVGEHSYIQTDAAINSGNSGGPLLDGSGKVIGVNSYKMSDAEGIGLAIPISTVTSFLSNNNISIDSNGNIGSIVKEPSQDTVSSLPKEQRENSASESQYNIILLIVLALSIVLNIILIIVIIFQRKKNINISYNPSERTDFDIDILE